ncbi:hypothetical protein KIN20_000689 [Parelaphostrongylus tenuis]|uniref:Uncharacterized protein n=1 Tax=Parelaphostrongylus tenuis TaxID=148309 RepID=A0AAD5LWH8_PARTN|nr:hypothetical protein KIN20_000689 [Parelaphostrongylus tenuis]
MDKLACTIPRFTAVQSENKLKSRIGAAQKPAYFPDGKLLVHFIVCSLWKHSGVDNHGRDES